MVMTKNKLLIFLLAISLFFAVSVSIAEVSADSSDKEIALQLDQQAKQLMISGDFALALEKFQAAEIMSPDAERAQRINKLQSFVTIRKNFTPSAAPQITPKEGIKKTAASPSLITSSDTTAISSKEEIRVRKAIDALLKFLHEYIDDVAELIITSDYQLTQSEESFYAEFADVKLNFYNYNSFDAGKLQLILKPDSNNKIHFVVKLNETIKAIEDNTTIAELTLEAQDIQGFWNEQLEIFEDVNVIIIKPVISVKDKEHGIIRADKLGFIQKLNHLNKDNKWQQSMEGYLTNFHLEAFDRKEKRQMLFKLDDININASISGRDFERIISLRKKLQENSLALNDDLSPEQSNKLVKTLQENTFELFSLLDFYETSAVLKGLSVVGSKDEGEFSLKEINFGLSAGAKEKDKGELIINFLASQINASGVPGMPPGMLPDNIELNLSVENFPSGISNTIREMNENPGNEEQIARQFGELLHKNKSNIALNKVAISFADYAVSMNANAIANINSPFFSTGEASLSVSNFPLIIEKIKQFGAPKEVNMMLSAIAMLSVRTEKNGKTTDLFDLVWTEDGKALLNGKDATALMSNSSKPSTTTSEKK